MPYPEQINRVTGENSETSSNYFIEQFVVPYPGFPPPSSFAILGIMDGISNALYTDLMFERKRAAQPYLKPQSGGDGEWEENINSEETKTELHDRFAFLDQWNQTYPSSLEGMDDTFVDFKTGSSWKSGSLANIFLGTILSIDQITGTNFYRSTTLAENQPVSILKSQFNVRRGVNTYPRVTDIVNVDTIYGSPEKNPLSSTKEYFSYDTLIFSNYIHYNLVNITISRKGGATIFRGNLTPFVILDDSPIQRKNRLDDSTVIVTYSPYSNATSVDFQNDRTWINSFFNNSFYWIW